MTALARAVTQVAKDIPAVRVLSYSKLDDFEFLWGLGNSKDVSATDRFAAVAGPLTLVIVWDGLPVAEQTQFGSARYLTPVDWAAGLALEHLGPSAGPSPAVRAVVVVAGRPPLSAEAARFAEAFPKADIPALPWVRLARCGEWPADGRGVATVVGQLAEELAHFPTLRDSADRAKHFQPFLLRQFQGAVLRPTRTDDHHGLANLIGPTVLLNEHPTDHRTAALRVLCRQLGMCPSSGKSEPCVDWAAVANGLPGTGPVRALLIDDGAATNRWADVLVQWFGADAVDKASPTGPPRLVGKSSATEPNLELYAVQEPEWLAERLKAQFGTADGGGRFRFGLGDSAAPEPIDLVFLDLRLFLGRSVAEEAKFVASLLELVKPKDGPLSGEFVRADEWATGAEKSTDDDKWHGDPRYADALAVPARVLSQLDPSLPIVLFSSTGRRDVIELLRSHAGVVTRFEKPRLLYPPADDMVESTRGRFADAVAAARPLVAARRLCRALLDAKFPAPPVLKPAASSGKWQAELFFDETGNKQDGMAIGGLLVVYPPGVDPLKVNAGLKKDFRAWFDKTRPTVVTRGGNVPNPKTFLGMPQVSEWFERHLPTLRDPKTGFPQLFVAGVRVAGALPATTAAIDDLLTDIRFGDNLHRRLAARLIEGVVFGVLPSLVPAGQTVTLGVFGGVRRYDDKHDPKDFKKAAAKKAEEKKLEDLWGVKFEYVDETELYEGASALLQLSVGALAKAHAAFPPPVAAALRALTPTLDAWLNDPANSGAAEEKDQVLDAADSVIRHLAVKADDLQQALSAQAPTDMQRLLVAADALRTAFGQYEKGKKKPLAKIARTLPADAVRPIVEDVIWLNDGAAFPVHTDTLRGYSINTFNKFDQSGGREFHLFADGMLKPDMQAVFAALTPDGFDEPAADSVLETLLRANRAVLRGERAEAIALAGRLCLARGAGKSRLARYVGLRLAAAVRELAADEVHHLADRLARS